jgi:hypothetical protein
VTSPKPGNCPAFMLKDYRMQRAGLLWQLRFPLSRSARKGNKHPECADVETQTSPSVARAK